MKKYFFPTIIFFAVIGIVFTVVKKPYFFSRDVVLDEQRISLLKALGDSALQHLDVPVASILLYNDTIIGSGYNTVAAHGNAGGHAEINAISSAMRTIGKEKFYLLDRKKLTLITTFEPCLMCRGAIIEYRIQNVVFLKPKTIFHWLTKHAQELLYEVTKKRTEPESLQDSLFFKHPLYNE